MDKTIDYKSLGQRIRTARKKKGMSQEKLGEICNVSAAHIGHIERGTRIASLEALFRISRELDVSTDWLLCDSGKGNDSELKNIFARIEGKDEDKVRVFLSAVRALADKIDEL